jgi:hypothetical protein
MAFPTVSGASTTAGVPDSLPFASVHALAGVLFVPEDYTVAGHPAIPGVPAVVGVPAVACVPAVPCVSTVADVTAISIGYAVASGPAIELYNKIKHTTPSAYFFRTDNIFGYRAIEYRTSVSKNYGTFGYRIKVIIFRAIRWPIIAILLIG